jgi:hypothetical protein
MLGLGHGGDHAASDQAGGFAISKADVFPGTEVAIVVPHAFCATWFDTRVLLICFRYGADLRVEPERLRSDLRTYLLQQSLPDSWQVPAVRMRG